MSQYLSTLGYSYWEEFALRVDSFLEELACWLGIEAKLKMCIYLYPKSGVKICVEGSGQIRLTKLSWFLDISPK